MMKLQLAGKDSSVPQVTGASCDSPRQLAGVCSEHLPPRLSCFNLQFLCSNLKEHLCQQSGGQLLITTFIFRTNPFAFVELQPSSLILLLVSTCSGLLIASHFGGVSSLEDNQSWCQLVRPGYHWLLRAGGGRQNMGAAAGAACVWLTYSYVFHCIYNISEPAASCHACCLPIWTHRCRGGSRQRFGVFKASVWAAKTFT